MTSSAKGNSSSQSTFRSSFRSNMWNVSRHSSAGTPEALHPAVASASSTKPSPFVSKSPHAGLSRGTAGAHSSAQYSTPQHPPSASHSGAGGSQHVSMPAGQHTGSGGHTMPPGKHQKTVSPVEQSMWLQTCSVSLQGTSGGGQSVVVAMQNSVGQSAHSSLPAASPSGQAGGWKQVFSPLSAQHA